MQNAIVEEIHKPQTLDVKVDEVTYGIFGVRHDIGTRRFYMPYLEELTETRDNWLFETCLKLYFNQKTGHQLPDGAGYPFKQLVSENLSNPIYDLMLTGILAWSILMPQTAYKNSRKKYANYKENFEIPQKPYSMHTKRSGYQAAFMKEWKKGQDKNIVVGQAHMPQIRYFLKHPIEDNRTIDVASMHAELLEKDPEKFKHVANGYALRDIAGMLTGGLVCYVPLYAAIEIIGHYAGKQK